MARKRYSSEQIIGYLREAEILQAKGSTIPQICKKIGVVEQTYYRWRQEYGSLSVDQARRLQEVEKENSRLRKLIGASQSPLIFFPRNKVFLYPLSTYSDNLCFNREASKTKLFSRFCSQLCHPINREQTPFCLLILGYCLPPTKCPPPGYHPVGLFLFR